MLVLEMFAVITRNNRPTRTSRASISSVSSLSSVVSEVASSCPASPVAPGLDNFSDLPGSPSYVEMVTGFRSRSPSPADSVSGAIGERLTVGQKTAARNLFFLVFVAHILLQWHKLPLFPHSKSSTCLEKSERV
ncbi:hypothetical protein G6F46_013993 [Rhizopus delemar]|uniref:Uncharacterized protein n=2 Tax=Rhizopus TaxID=4842 RepID=A0A9P7C418_9FUNG|nr:hypothetical protein G6F55_013602 [Rhizopus delemar]KAG1530071.1 hypothetical protein G6F51_013953 [Rhizopus arrhizus]KAG1487292.1 hypothetical protein G6F53_013775 [Rhizopus delemar]KAG1532945.1 hypothetical protein G6F49_013613 [Rhizopus delemar]KAG1534367.1 hypothetical protein G6F50_015586 [Rhizopus delemar]